MESFNASHKVTCWKDVGEFEEVIKWIFDNLSSMADKKKALNKLQAWKVRRAQDTPLGILSTIPLLDVLIKDLQNEIRDSSVINTLYQNSIMKFINFALSFDSGNFTMYAAAKNLQLDSFLIDLRHSISHGKQSFNLEVLRNCHKLCMNWIKEYYWENEKLNIADVDIKDLRFDADLEKKLDNILPFYDILAELRHKNIKTFEELEQSVSLIDARWPTVKSYMEEKKFTSFFQAFKHFQSLVIATMASKNVRLNTKTFFHALLTKCDYFMQAYENSNACVNVIDEDEDEEIQILTPAKRQKLASSRNSRTQSIVNLYQDLIWHIAKNDYLPLFIEMLLQIYCNQGEKQPRRQSAHFWIMITLKSYQYYQQYCEYTKSNAIDQTGVTQETRNIYSYQLNADLNNVFIFVGTQILPSHLKYSREFLAHLMENMDDSEEDCSSMYINFMPLVYPPLSDEQIGDMKKLIGIKTSGRRSAKTVGEEEKSTIHTVKELTKQSDTCEKEAIWTREDSQICWSSLPIGYEFKV